MFFNDWLSRRRIYTPDRVAVVDDTCGRRYTFRELDARASRLASFLKGPLCVRPGDRVACLSTNRVEYLDLYFACGKIGAMLVPLNVRFPAVEIVDLLQDCQAQLLVYESAFAEIAAAASRAGVISQLLPLDSADQHGDRRSVGELLADDQASDELSDVYEADEDDVAMILYTSGTTGRAKGAMISYRQIHWNAVNTTIGLQLTQNDVTFLNMPLYHIGGWHVLFTPLMQLGGRVILQSRFNAERCNKLIGTEGVTILFGVPTMLRMMWEAPNFAAADFSSVRCAIFGGEPCPLPVIEAYQERGVAMRQGYGLTEAGPNCFSLPAEDAIRKRGSIGFPNFHVGVRLVKENGSEAGVGEVGELWMKGPHVFTGYWADAKATAETLRDGWISTGDLMTRDDEGYYYVVGRKKEMYVSGGENIYPAQVERILHLHEAVAQAAVIGVPDPKWGETGWAFVKLHTGRSLSEPELIGWCKQHMAAFQCPTKIVIADDLPIGPSGKIDKLLLSQRATGHLAR
jgi:fatty-acyl-CoA synthase